MNSSLICITSVDVFTIFSALIAACATIIVGIHLCDYFKIRAIDKKVDNIMIIQQDLILKQKETDYNLIIAKGLAVLSIQPYSSAKHFFELIQKSIEDDNAVYCKKGIKGLIAVGKWIDYMKRKGEKVSEKGKQSISLSWIDSLPNSEIRRTFENEIVEALNRFTTN